MRVLMKNCGEGGRTGASRPSISSHLFLFLFIFTILGMQLFGDAPDGCAGEHIGGDPAKTSGTPS